MNVNEIKELEYELKYNKRLGKLHTEIYLLWKYSNSGLIIGRPQGTDCIIKTEMKEYQIEVHQPNTSKVRSLNNDKKKDKVNIIEKNEIKRYPHSKIITKYFYGQKFPPIFKRLTIQKEDTWTIEELQVTVND